MVLDVMEDDDILLWIINVYYDSLTKEFNLDHLFKDLYSLIPIMVISDINTHCDLWSLLDYTPSRWESCTKDWIENNGLTVLNPEGIHSNLVSPMSFPFLPICDKHGINQ